MAKKDSEQALVIMYTSTDGQTKLQVKIDPSQNTTWLTQLQMAELFQTSKQNISKHINKIFADGELDQNSVVNQKLTTAADGKPYKTLHYNLKMILAVGYRMDSQRGIQFRTWASNILDEYIRKGFSMNDELLKQAGGGSFFKELLDRIRDIRSSEKVFYRQVLDLFATSIDYDAKSETAIEFFKEMQNKLFFSITQKTAPELIAGRANAELPFMGVQAFKGTRPQKHEVTVAKSYLYEKEIESLKHMVVAYLELAEMKAKEEIPMYMKDWVQELDRFINFQNKPLLDGKGKVTREDANEIALAEYDVYMKKSSDELTQVEQDYLETIKRTYALLESKKKK